MNFSNLGVHKYSPKLIIQADLNRGIPFDPLCSLLRLLSGVLCLCLFARSFVVLPFLLLEGCYWITFGLLGIIVGCGFRCANRVGGLDDRVRWVGLAVVVSAEGT